MSILRAIADLFRAPSAQRLTQRRLREAKLLLVEHACHLEYYRHSVAMLTERIARIESESAGSAAQMPIASPQKSATQIPQITIPAVAPAARPEHPQHLHNGAT